MLTEREEKRYQRQTDISSWGADGQEKLKNSRVFVAGAGGLGGPVLYYLAGAGVGTITLCDFDVVDLSNLNRQILHREESVGISKAESAFNTLTAFNSDIEIIPVREKITDDNAEDLLAGNDIIVDCLDNFETRQVLNRYAVNSGIPLIHGGIEDFNGQVTFIHPPETPCLACFLPAGNSGKKINVPGATAGLTGSIQAMEAIKFLVGMESGLKNKLLFIDGRDMRFVAMKISPGGQCPVCGHLHRQNENNQ